MGDLMDRKDMFRQMQEHSTRSRTKERVDDGESATVIILPIVLTFKQAENIKRQRLRMNRSNISAEQPVPVIDALQAEMKLRGSRRGSPKPVFFADTPWIEPNATFMLAEPDHFWFKNETMGPSAYDPNDWSS